MHTQASCARSAGAWFRQFVMDELVKSIDALSRDQAHLLAQRLGLAGLPLPVLLPGAHTNCRRRRRLLLLCGVWLTCSLQRP